MTKYLSSEKMPYFINKFMTEMVADHDEVEELYMQYVHPVLPHPYVYPYDVPDEPSTIYIYYYWDTKVLYFTHDEQPDNSKYGTLTRTYTFYPTSRFYDDEDMGVNQDWYYQQIDRIESDPIRAPKYLDYFFFSVKNENDWSFLEKWETSFVESMQGTFYTSNIKELSPVKHWNTSAVKNLELAFMSCRQLTDVSGLSEWDTSSVTQFSNCFQGDTSVITFEPLNDWDVSKATSKSRCFRDVTAPLPKWVDSSWT